MSESKRLAPDGVNTITSFGDEVEVITLVNVTPANDRSEVICDEETFKQIFANSVGLDKESLYEG